ncbi:unnamed protein product [Paramecium primaurelia]|uniref:Uncharacterized protein n=2 Tax=Paramecium TaxID=5884 RepID=A0A8S1Y554_9CILI|nr:unnamed protein product [Paramecium primaurelia]CAD8208700.1 unnamed protein product [Paramecium pentaurelia]
MNERIETQTQTYICITEIEKKQKKFVYPRVDKYNHPIIKGVKGKRISFRDIIEKRELCDIYMVQKYHQNKENSKCSCSCSIQ